LSAIAVAAGSVAVAGAISAGITGGSVLKGALFGGISGALFAAVGAPLGRALSAADMLGNPLAGNFITQGFVGGLNSTIEGGNFGSGFLAGGVGSLAGSWSGGPFDPGHMLASAIAGGAASVLGGGKFANGAITGAFAYAAGSLASEADSETVDPDLLGKHIDLTLPSGMAGPDLEAKVMAAITDIDQANGLTTNQIDILHGINSIVVSDSLTRSYVDEASGTFYLQAQEVQNASVPFLASDIGHDAFHIYEYG